MLSVLVTIAVVGLLVFWLGSSYRRILRLRILVTHAWRRLDELVKQRIETIGRAIELARNAGIHGAELDRVAHAHARATPYRGPADAARRNTELDLALQQLISLMGQHTGLGGPLRAISDDLGSITGSVASARAGYNDRAATYNRAIEALPGNLLAGMAGFHRAEVF